jgi:hypothetical protein
VRNLTGLAYLSVSTNSISGTRRFLICGVEGSLFGIRLCVGGACACLTHISCGTSMTGYRLRRVHVFRVGGKGVLMRSRSIAGTLDPVRNLTRLTDLRVYSNKLGGMFHSLGKFGACRPIHCCGCLHVNRVGG